MRRQFHSIQARAGLVSGLLALAIASGGCGLTRRMALDAMVPILDDTVKSTWECRDLQTVREGVPGNLLVLRGLTASEPGNEEIRTLTVQTAFSYALGFVEDDDPGRASLLYRDGMETGLEGLRRHAWFRRAEQGGALPDPEGLRGMSRDDVPLLFWTVASWTSWVGLNLTDPAAVADLPRIEAYLERILALDAEFFLGLPHMMAGTLLTIRPRIMGGDPERGRVHFDEALRISEGRMLLFHMMYARYYCRQTLDEECFDRHLSEVLEAPPDLLPSHRLFNLVAKEKARRLMEKRDEFF